MQPFDYTINAVNPTQAFMQSFQAGSAIAQQQAARQQQETQRQQAARLQNALSGLGPNANSGDFMALVQQFPDLAEPLTKQYRTFDDARKNGMFSAGERAFMLLRPGADGAIAVDGAVASLEESAAAFENSGQPDIAKQLRDSAKAARLNPAAARTALGTMLAFADPDKFKKVGDALGQGELTAFQKNLAAANIDPASDEGKRLSRQYVQNQVDPIVTMETPSGAQFIGPMSEYQNRYGGAPATAPRRLPSPKSKAEFDALPSGADFVAPDGSVRRKP